MTTRLEFPTNLDANFLESLNRTLDLQGCPICGSDTSAPYLQAPDRFHLRNTVYSLMRCPSCSLVWLQDPPAPDDAHYHYGADYHKSIRMSGEEELAERWRAPRERVLRTVRGGALLDIGCSSGAFLRTLQGDGLQLFGIEISPDEARKAEMASGARVFAGGILDAPFANESFDIITCFDVLEHVYDLQKVVERVRQWLKPGGIFYVIVPNIDALEARMFQSYWYGLELPRHLYHFSPSSLARLFESLQFEQILLRTLPACYVEQSLRYIADDVFVRLGVRRTSLAATPPSAFIPWRIIRKALRFGCLWPFRRLSAVAGHGSAIEAAFRKSA
jgi:SAM-dependent methyltransferase